MDVEGYEPQVFESASRLFADHPPPVLQLEVNKFHNNTPEAAAEMCAFENMLVWLEAIGYRFRELPNIGLDHPLNRTSVGFRKQLSQEQRQMSRRDKEAMTWRSLIQLGASSWDATPIFPLLPQFPSVDVRSGVAKRGQPKEHAIVVAYRQFPSYSTNLIGVHSRRLQTVHAGHQLPHMDC